MSSRRVLQPIASLLPLFILVLTISCSEQTTRPELGAELTPAPTRLAGSGGFRFEPLSSSATCRNPDAASYLPLDLPGGFTQTIIATQRDDFAPVAGSGGDLPDMLTLNENGPQAGRFLYRTHEVRSNGAITATDLWTGETHLVIQVWHYERLDGIVWTPWGTLLFAEEVFRASFPDPDFPNTLAGLVYEYDPRTGVAVPRPALGARPHEGMRIDPMGNIYGISESRGLTRTGQSGAIFKFVPDRRGDLSTGQLYALKVLDGASRTGPAEWLPLDRDAVQIDSDAEAIRAGATAWERPEDVAIATSTGNHRGGANVVYASITDENLVLRIELHGDRAYVSNYVKGGVNVPDGQGLPDRVTAFDDPDNLALDPFGNLYIAEDEAPGDIWVALAGRGSAPVADEVVLFASLSDCRAEPTGIYFDRSGRTLWLNVQHAGGSSNDLTVAITRGADSHPFTHRPKSQRPLSP
ncbi:MAG: PhoX family protein [Candidatus Krumholzibacteria bacterium]|nr:PhoX family protein [Candidatus Krumholzibacteria bacterium]